MQDRRRMVRDRVYYGGVLAFNARRSTFACVVRNFSASGAKIEFEGTSLLPTCLDFRIGRRGLACRARLVRRAHRAPGLVCADARQTSDVVSLDLARAPGDTEPTTR